MRCYFVFVIKKFFSYGFYAFFFFGKFVLLFSFDVWEFFLEVENEGGVGFFKFGYFHFFWGVVFNIWRGVLSFFDVIKY